MFHPLQLCRALRRICFCILQNGALPPRPIQGVNVFRYVAPVLAEHSNVRNDGWYACCQRLGQR